MLNPQHGTTEISSLSMDQGLLAGGSELLVI